jgi:hypothetical protein
MAEQTREDTEQTAAEAVETQDGSTNGVVPSGTVGTGVALTIGGAVVGALVALMRGRRAADDGEGAADKGPELADDLAARASAAARGDENDEDEGEADETGHDAQDAVPVAQAAGTEAGADAAAVGEHDEQRPAETRAEATGERESEIEPEPESGPGAGEPEATAEPRAEDMRESREPEHDDEEGQARDGGVTGAASVARSAARQLAELTGREPESVLGVARRDGGWIVTLETVEVARTPPTTDILGRYEVELAEDGELVEYQQSGRYVRSRAAESG